MPALFIENVPASIYDRLRHLAESRQRTPADTVLEVLDVALPPTKPARSDAPLPSEPFMTEEICAPFDIPWSEGELVVPIHFDKDIPEPHDLEGLE